MDSRIKSQLNKAIKIIKNCDLPEQGPFSINVLYKISIYVKNFIIAINAKEFNNVTFKIDHNM